MNATGKEGVTGGFVPPKAFAEVISALKPWIKCWDSCAQNKWPPPGEIFRPCDCGLEEAMNRLMPKEEPMKGYCKTEVCDGH